jgi:hydrogenase/urease accessory protein HupE
MDLTQYVLLAAVIAGVVELIKRLRAADYWSAITIIIAVIVGAIFGLAGIEGLDVVHGIAVSFGLVGALTALAKTGSGSTAAPSNPA